MPLFRNKNKLKNKKTEIDNKNQKSNSKFKSDDAVKDNNSKEKKGKILNWGNADEPLEYANQSNDDNEKKLTSSFEKNIEIINEIFDCDDTIVKRSLKNKERLDFYIFYSDGLVNSIILDQNIMQPLLRSEVKKAAKQ